MKNILTVILLTAAMHTASGQNNEVKGKDPSGNLQNATPVETMPVFPEGDVMRYIASRVNYPEKARDNGTQGTVWISFVVDSSGLVKDAKVEKGFDSECDAEALRVVSALPRWKPGTISGKAVPVKYTMPVKFSIVEKGRLKKKKRK